MNPNFEQYKIDQAEIDKVPTIKPEFHFTINDIAKKLLGGQDLTEKEIGDLEMIYDMTQNLEKDLVTFLDDYRSKETLSKEEFLITCDYFLTANQNGPDSESLKISLTSNSLPPEEFRASIENISIPEHTKAILNNVYTKINKKEAEASSLFKN
ncbi:MAG: hypothetical protein KBB54_03285 [Candidatus Pacebacteria bacterium]|jgi:hypothetical protein|nr:hypothetical protein [Candidatus Paceibacterota bacterium]